tara:strand:+ start:3809 stop:5191 length:1383 start_codon:yes stop_codon:yes gene_type:complete
MGVLENILITLDNGDEMNIVDIEPHCKLLSCGIEGLNDMSSNKEAIGWYKLNPIIIKNTCKVKSKWVENINIYMVINDKLKISLDTGIMFKNLKGETTWGFSKSLRKGYSLFNDKYEYEEIKTIKKVRENVKCICLTVYPFSFYFAGGYLLHNTSICDVCDTCHLWPTMFTSFGPHAHGSDNHPLSQTYWGTDKTQKDLYHIAGTTGTNAPSSPTDNTELHSINRRKVSNQWTYNYPNNYKYAPWNRFKNAIDLKNNDAPGQHEGDWTGHAYFVAKSWDRSAAVPTMQNFGADGFYPEVGWKAWHATSNQYTTVLNTVKDHCRSEKGVPFDPWGHARMGPDYYGEDTTPRYLRLVEHHALGHDSTEGEMSYYYSVDDGVNWSSEIFSRRSNTGSHIVSGGFDVIESDHGGMGKSKIHIIYKIPAPATELPDGRRHLFYWQSYNSTISLHGWAEFVAYYES